MNRKITKETGGNRSSEIGDKSRECKALCNLTPDLIVPRAPGHRFISFVLPSGLDCQVRSVLTNLRSRVVALSQLPNVLATSLLRGPD
jgi:hypothetical protein